MKKWCIMFVLLILCLTLTACTGREKIDATGDADLSPPEEKTEAVQEDERMDDLYSVEGEIVGLIDSNSFEAVIGGQAVAFRLEDAIHVFEEKKIGEGDEVVIGYILIQNQQKVAKVIQKK